MAIKGALHVKFSRPTFIFLEALVNGAIFYLAPLIPNAAVQGFVVVVGNSAVIYLATESPKSGVPVTQAPA